MKSAASRRSFVARMAALAIALFTGAVFGRRPARSTAVSRSRAPQARVTPHPLAVPRTKKGA